MQTSPAMRDKIAEWEGCRLIAYRDPVGIWTIGVGHTGPVDGEPVGPGMRISAEKADQLLSQDLARFEEAVERLTQTTTQAQFDALVSFAFNLGEGALERSTLRKLHNAGRYADAAYEFGRWNKAGGKVLTGLTRRRQGERRIYAQGDYDSGPERTG